MSLRIGKKWIKNFDIVICDAKKHKFFESEADFYKINTENGRKVGKARELKMGEVYSGGNVKMLSEFFYNGTWVHPQIMHVCA